MLNSEINKEHGKRGNVNKNIFPSLIQKYSYIYVNKETVQSQMKIVGDIAEKIYNWKHIKKYTQNKIKQA